MFDNISQALYNVGTTGYLIIVPVLRLLATILMAVSTYILLKARNDKHKVLWIMAILFSPIIARIVYEIYYRVIDKRSFHKPNASTIILIISVVAFILSAVLTVISAISIGVGYIKSELDGEPIAIFYDVHGNEYYDLYDVPLYDKIGNVYTHKSAWFTAGTYVDQNGKVYDADACYLGEDGYFYYDEDNTLEPFQDSYNYYTDGETVYYDLFNRVYWEEDGSIYEFTGSLHLELFDFD